MEAMTNAELVEAFTNFQTLIDSQFQYWLSISFAAIVAGAFAGEKLTPRIRWFLTFLYVTTTAMFILRFNALSSDLGVFYAEIGTRELLELLNTQELVLLTGSRYLVWIVGSIGTIWFMLSGSKLELNKSPADQ